MITRSSAKKTLVLTLGSLLWLASPLAAQKIRVIYSEQHAVSPPLRDIAMPVPAFQMDLGEVPNRRALLPPQPPQGDTAVQTLPSGPATAVVGLNFDGVGAGFNHYYVSVAPPDTNGAPGLNQYVQWVNLAYAVFDKSTGNLILGPVAGNSLWKGFPGACSVTDDGDIIAQYDKAANRWVMSQFSWKSLGTLAECVAVSTTSDATGTYNLYQFNFTAFPDYPKMGIWPDAYYMSFNMFQGNTLIGAQACAFDRNAMLNGASTAAAVCFQLDSTVASLLPSDLDGSNPPPFGSPNYFVNFGTNALNLWKFHADFGTPANSTFTGPTLISVTSFNPACGGGICVPQPGSAQLLDSLGDRLMYRLAYRNFNDHESLVVNHSVDNPGGGVGVRWYEVQNPNGTPTVFQQSTFAPDASYRWMGSVAMDGQGNMALGYSISSSGIYPGVRFTGRMSTDPANTMQDETAIVAGTGSVTSGASAMRWGDYSSMAIDPVDDCTFWYTQEYIKFTAKAPNWNTRIANFKFPGCGVVKFNLSVTLAGAGSGMVTSNPSGINCGATCSDQFDQNTVVALTATPAAGALFAGWSGACTGTGACSLTMSSDQSVTATFVPSQFTLSVAKPGTGAGSVISRPAGINCGATCSSAFANGASVTLKALPAAGSAFLGWTGPCQVQGNICTLTMSAAITVGAVFNDSAVSFPLTVTRDGVNIGTVMSKPAGINCGGTCSGNFTQDMVVTLQVTTGKVKTWGGDCSGTGPRCTLTMDTAKTATVTFR